MLRPNHCSTLNFYHCFFVLTAIQAPEGPNKRRLGQARQGDAEYLDLTHYNRGLDDG